MSKARRTRANAASCLVVRRPAKLEPASGRSGVRLGPGRERGRRSPRVRGRVFRTLRDAATPNTEPTEDSVDENGVDLTLIRWMLSLSPRERLRVLQQQINAVRRLQDAGRAAR